MKTDKAIELFKLGDRIGSSYESGSINPSFKVISIEEIMENYKKAGRGTDESDTVDCFLKFTEEYQFKNPEQFILDWFVFHANNRSAYGYGRTLKDHFVTVQTLRAKNKLTTSELLSISIDRNSYGNGCLFLVYPLYRYFRELGLSPEEKEKWVCEIGKLTHAHRSAGEAVRFLYDIVTNKGDTPGRTPYIE